MIRTVLVEDDDAIRQLYRTIIGLSNDFLVVGEGRNGIEGIEVSREQQPDLILLDVMMPVMDGIAALPLIRDVAPEAKVVYLTALSLWLVETEAGERILPEPDAILEKATPPLTVLKMLRDIVGRR